MQHIQSNTKSNKMAVAFSPRTMLLAMEKKVVFTADEIATNYKGKQNQIKQMLAKVELKVRKLLQ